MGNYVFFVYIGCIIIILFLGKVFFLPIKKIFKLILNSLVGAGALYIINLVGQNFNFHIGINWGTILCTGLFGIPGLILVILLKLV